ncbi:MAG: type II secretion system secretin GspD [Planctomycetales bacterium]|nr:type II secretion system secretin GspD [Planctomycetales bacterium]
MTTNRLLVAGIAGTFAWATVHSPALAQEPAPVAGAAQDVVGLNLDGAPLEDMIDLVAHHSQKIFLFQDRLKQVKIYSKGRRLFPAKHLFSVFQSILELNGFALATIAEGTPAEVIKVVESRNMRRYPMKTFDHKELTAARAKNEELMPTDEAMITMTYGLQYSSAREVSNALRPLSDPNAGGQIIGIDKVEVLVITDYAPNVQRLERVIELMDVPGPQLKWEVVPLLYANPDDLVSKISQFFETLAQVQQQQGAQVEPRIRLVSYPRTNSIIVQAVELRLREVKDLIKVLDVQLQVEPSRIHIRKLRHTDAEKVAETVNAILQVRPTLAEQPAAGTPMPQGPQGPQVGPRPIPSPGTRFPSGGGLGTGTGEPPAASAIADKTTNSLIVVAMEPEWKELSRIVDQLDVRRPQVLIEAAIVELTSQETYNVGVELATIDQPAQDSTRGFVATQFGLSNLVDANGVPITTTTPGVPAGRIPNTSSQGITLGLTRDNAFRIPVLLNLIGTESATNVLSLPRVLTNDNEKATVKVSESVPTSQLSNVGTPGIAPTQSFGSFQEAGITMTITPHISEADYLNLEMKLTIEQFTGSSTDPALPPPKATRDIENRITVPNHQTVIIGGLTSTRTLEAVTKIPLLGDIPLLGLLFQRQDKRETKTHLFIFLTPHVLTDDRFRDMGMLTKSHLADMRAQGVNADAIDVHYREAFRDESWPGAGEGRAPTRLTYRSLRE